MKVKGKNFKFGSPKGDNYRGDYEHDYQYKLSTSYYRITQEIEFFELPGTERRPNGCVPPFFFTQR